MSRRLLKEYITQILDEALKNQNRTLIKNYTNIIFNKVKDYVEKSNPKQLFSTSEIIDLKSDFKNVTCSAKISFFRSETPNVDIHADVKSYQGDQALTIYVELGLSGDYQQNMNVLKKQYPKIVQQLQEVITHELVHVSQNVQKYPKTPEGYSKKSKETLDKLQFDNEFEKEMYFGPHAAPNPFFSLDEIEAYAKGLVRAFQKSKSKYNASFSEFLAKTLNDKPNIMNKSSFFDYIIQYVSKTYPNILLGDTFSTKDKFLKK